MSGDAVEWAKRGMAAPRFVSVFANKSHDHDGFWDRPGNPIQSMSSSLTTPPQNEISDLPLTVCFSRFVDTQLYVTSQLAIAVPLGLIAFLTFCVLRTKWSQFYMSLWRGRGRLSLSTLSRGFWLFVIQAVNYRTWEMDCCLGFLGSVKSLTTKSSKQPDSMLTWYALGISHRKWQ